jgi:hypothetical protein
MIFPLAAPFFSLHFAIEIIHKGQGLRRSPGFASYDEQGVRNRYLFFQTLYGGSISSIQHAELQALIPLGKRPLQDQRRQTAAPHTHMNHVAGAGLPHLASKLPQFLDPRRHGLGHVQPTRGPADTFLIIEVLLPQTGVLAPEPGVEILLGHLRQALLHLLLVWPQR